jgi:hypothetical protein
MDRRRAGSLAYLFIPLKGWHPRKSGHAAQIKKSGSTGGQYRNVMAHGEESAVSVHSAESLASPRAAERPHAAQMKKRNCSTGVVE